MSRLERRIQFLNQHADEGTFNPEQHVIEAAIRSRTGRKVRNHLRRMDPVVMTTPRWSRPQAFLEDIALDLAVGEPALGCRTVSFLPLKGRPGVEAWFFVLQVLAQLSVEDWSELRVPTVASRIGFRTVVTDLLQKAQERPDRQRVAMLAHGAEFLPIDVIEDLADCWSRFAAEFSYESNLTMLLAGAIDSPADALDGAVEVELADYGEAEAAAVLVGRSGPATRTALERAARFTGGIPAVVENLGSNARDAGSLPPTNSALLRLAGPVVDEIRGAVDIASGDSALAGRLDQLRLGEPLVEVPEVDRPLMMAGLLRKVRMPGVDRVMLRGPIIGAVLS